jgi:hypothetical protein
LVKLKLESNQNPSSISNSNSTQVGSTKTYVGTDLKISFDYPSSWYIDDQYPFILITNYYTSLNDNVKPKFNQMELIVSQYSSCYPDYEDNLIYPGCGEGGEASKNTIVSKEGRLVQAGTFYKYVVKTPRDQQFVYYILYKDAKHILQIEKHPDPSQYEEEFTNIVNSLRFL